MMFFKNKWFVRLIIWLLELFYGHSFIKKLNYKKVFHFISWAHSLTDRITGFGPVDGGSIPPVLI